MFKVGTTSRLINNKLGTPIQGAGTTQVRSQSHVEQAETTTFFPPLIAQIALYI